MLKYPPLERTPACPRKFWSWTSCTGDTTQNGWSFQIVENLLLSEHYLQHASDKLGCLEVNQAGCVMWVLLVKATKMDAYHPDIPREMH